MANSEDLAAARDVVRDVGWLSQVPRGFRDGVLDESRLREYDAGERVYDISNSWEGVFGMIAGGFRITSAPEANGPFALHFAGPSFWIGSAPMFTGAGTLLGISAAHATRALYPPR